MFESLTYLESDMKDYIVTHTFKTEEAREQYFSMAATLNVDDIRSLLKNESASVQMNWNAGVNDMIMYCWWKADSPEAIIDTLGEMAGMFENEIREMPDVIDLQD